MRAAGLSTFALLGLHTVGVQGEITCHTNNPLTNWSVTDLSNVYDAIIGPVVDLCNKGLLAENAIITLEAGDVTFEITRDGSVQGAEDCNAAFAAIFVQCIGGQNAGGRKVDSGEGVMYEIYYAGPDQPTSKEFSIEGRDQGDIVIEDDVLDSFWGLIKRDSPDSSLEARAPKGGKVKKPNAKPTPKPKPKPTLKSKSGKATKTSSSIKAGPTKTCKQLIALASKEKKSIRPEARDIDINDALEERDGHVGSMATIQKRATKKGMACKIVFNALGYPNEGHKKLKTVRYYGYKEPGVCKNMAWGDATFKGKKAVGKTAGALYEVEHILEWQLVTKFFDYLNDDIFKDDTFDHPDPSKVVSGKREKINFCTYWVATWKDGPTFALGSASAKRDSMTHLKWAYPGTQNYIEEFVMLEKNINAPAKTQMWKKKTTSGIYDDSDMKKLSDDVNTAQVAVLKLKWLMGARRYMKDPKVKEILKKQKERIGERLGQLDKELQNHPKPGFDAWQHKDLENLWDKYMDRNFDTAVSRTTFDMDKGIKYLQAKHVTTKNKKAQKNDDLVGTIKTIASEWRKEKNSKWINPWSDLTQPLAGEADS